MNVMKAIQAMARLVRLAIQALFLRISHSKISFVFALQKISCCSVTLCCLLSLPPSFSLFLCVCLFLYVCMYVCVYVSMFVRMYVCMCVYVYVYVCMCVFLLGVAT